MIRRNFKTILVFISVCIAGVALNQATDSITCNIIYMHDSFLNMSLHGLLVRVAQIIITLLIGVCLFLLIKRYFKNFRYFKYLYFGILPFFVFYPLFLQIPAAFKNRAIEESICNKLSKWGSTAKDKSVDLTEYNYIKEHYTRLPDLPVSSTDIKFTYYSDDFKGEGFVDVNFNCSLREKIDTVGKTWIIEKVDAKHGIQKVVYESEQQ